MSRTKTIDSLFILAAFCGSSLIFVVQPMIARQLLPTLGGAPAVWTTCMLFFQTCLLVGYGWAHFGPKILGDRPHAIAHIALLIAAAFFLPLGIAAGWKPSGTNPALNVLTVLTLSIGLPMCALSATSPLLQRWHHAVNPERGDRVYRLYAIGNIASLIVLLAYPVLIEPTSTLRTQRFVWSWLFGGLATLLALCAIIRATRKTRVESTEEIATPTTWKNIAWWIVLSAIPSSYLLGVTSYLTSDVAAVPFLWVLPLALYLGAFSLAFAGKSPPGFIRYALAPALALLSLVLVGCAYTVTSVPLAIVMHVGTFFVLAFGCLAELFRRRPSGSALTGYYLWIAVGGAIGGAFNSLVAPIVFSTTLEYPIAVLVCAALAIGKIPQTSVASDPKKPTVLGPGFVRIMIFVVLVAATVYAIRDSSARFVLSPNTVVGLLGIPIIICFILRRHPIGFGLCAGTLAGAMLALGFSGEGSMERHRSFFGVHRVVVDPTGHFLQIWHGTTLHGQQMYDPETQRPIRPDIPLTYYQHNGPLGQVFQTMQPKRVGVVGLGVGNIAAYMQRGDVLRYFEIDPVVIALAQRTARFTYLQSARERGVDLDIIKGDARLTLNDRDDVFDLLVLDAFSGDAIPAHLLTREAFEMYAHRLAPGGTLLVHISNRYLDLRHVVAGGATVVAPRALIKDEYHMPEVEKQGRTAATWMCISRDPAVDAALVQQGWGPSPAGKAWSDDYIDLLHTLK